MSLLNNIIFLTILAACSTAETKRQPRTVKAVANDFKLKPKSSPTPFSTEVRPQIIAETAIKDAPNRSESSCRKFYRHYFLNYQKLYNKKSQEVLIGGRFPKDEDMRKSESDYCDSEDGRALLLTNLSKLINLQSGKIGVILPYKTNHKAEWILDGIRARMKELNQNPDLLIILHDSLAVKNDLEKTIANMFFSNQISMLIGGYESSEIPTLSFWASRIFVPTVLLGDPPKDFSSKTSQVFFAYPSQKQYAKFLIAEAKARSLTRLGLIYPTTFEDKEFISAIKEQSQSQIELTAVEIYQSGNFDSMDRVAKKLFEMDQSSRPEEYKEAFEKAKKVAEAQSLPFSAKNVVMQPKINFDGLIILDQVRMVRHFAKIFQFYGVRDLRLIGTQEWRLPTLIQPFDPFFENSFFVDTIGSYSRVSKNILSDKLADEYLIAPDRALQIDFNQLGYQVASTFIESIAASKAPRRKIESFIFTKFKFNESKTLPWPYQVINVRNGRFVAGSRQVP